MCSPLVTGVMRRWCWQTIIQETSRADRAVRGHYRGLSENSRLEALLVGEPVALGARRPIQPQNQYQHHRRTQSASGLPTSRYSSEIVSPLLRHHLSSPVGDTLTEKDELRASNQSLASKSRMSFDDISTVGLTRK